MHSKVSSDWLPSYIKAMRPVLEIYKMVGYFPDSPRIYTDRQVNHFKPIDFVFYIVSFCNYSSL
jgi:hypothetical protein